MSANITCMKTWKGDCMKDRKKEHSDTGISRKVFMEMLSDLYSLKGMVCAARQMIGLTENGCMDQEDRDLTLNLYCKNAMEITDKWAEFKKISL